MFLRLPYGISTHVQRTALLLNTVVLIAALVVAELVYSEVPKEKREHLKYFYPLFLILVGLLLYAGYKQVGKG